MLLSAVVAFVLWGWAVEEAEVELVPPRIPGRSGGAYLGLADAAAGWEDLAA